VSRISLNGRARHFERAPSLSGLECFNKTRPTVLLGRDFRIKHCRASLGHFFVLRRTRPDLPRPYRTWGYPVVPAIFVLFCVALLIITFASKPREATMGLVLMATGVPFYLYWNRNR